MEIVNIVQSESKCDVILELTTQYNINHTIEISMNDNGRLYCLRQSEPLHPHISGSSLCLDQNASSLIYRLLREHKFEDAASLLGLTLEIVDLKNAYGNRYSSFKFCHSCKKWVHISNLNYCSTCMRSFCNECSSKCECGYETASCPMCSDSDLFLEKCFYCIVEKGSSDRTIYRLDLSPHIFKLLEDNQIFTVNKLKETVDSNTKIPGIGSVRLKEITDGLLAFTL
jgi:hypothetical protein